MVKRRSFLTGLLALPAALWPFKAEAKVQYYPDSPLYWDPSNPPDTLRKTASEIKAMQDVYDARLRESIVLRNQAVQRMKFLGFPVDITNPNTKA